MDDDLFDDIVIPDVGAVDRATNRAIPSGGRVAGSAAASLAPRPSSSIVTAAVATGSAFAPAAALATLQSSAAAQSAASIRSNLGTAVVPRAPLQIVSAPPPVPAPKPSTAAALSAAPAVLPIALRQSEKNATSLSEAFAQLRDEAAGLFEKISAGGSSGDASGAASGSAGSSGGAAGGAGGGGPRPPPPKAGTIHVSPKQKGNPILKHLRHVFWEISPDLVPDYQLGRGTCALYLSLRYHALHPNYLFKRIKELRNDYTLRIVLVQVDVGDVDKLMLSVCHTAILSDCTVVCAFSPAEAARYLETYKAYENKPATAIQERIEDAYLPKVTELLTSIRSVNRTDVLTLLSHFGSVAGVMMATPEQLAMCPGFGDKKVRRVWEAFHGVVGTGPARSGTTRAAAGAGGGRSTGGGGVLHIDDDDD